MEIRHLKYFVTVAEELHFGRAAQRLGISQPPLSQQIKAFELEIGARLFDRTKHKVLLTEVGATLLTEAYRFLEHAERIRSVARLMNSGTTTRLNIGCISSVFFDVLPPILDRIHVQHPHIGLSMCDYETTAAVTALLQARLDVAFVRLDKVGPPLKLWPVMEDHFIAALPHHHRLTRHKVVPIEELAGEPLVIYSRQMSPHPYDNVTAACAKAGFAPNLAYQSTSIQSHIGFVACGLGIALVPNLVRHWHIPRVTYRPLSVPIKAAGISLAWNTSARTDAVDVFLQTARDVLSHFSLSQSRHRRKAPREKTKRR